MATSDNAKITEALALCRWLDADGAELRPVLGEYGKLRQFSPGQWIYGEGDPTGGICIVVSGIVQIFAAVTGERDVLLSQFSQGYTFGQSPKFGGGPRLLTAICVTECQILKIDDDVLERIALRHPSIWKAQANIHYLHLRSMVQRLAELIGLPPRQRLAAHLVRLAASHNGSELLQLGQQTLSDMLGLSRKTVNAYLSELETQKLIRRKYATIEVIDFPGLQTYAATVSDE